MQVSGAFLAMPKLKDTSSLMSSWRILPGAGINDSVGKEKQKRSGKKSRRRKQRPDLTDEPHTMATSKQGLEHEIRERKGEKGHDVMSNQCSVCGTAFESRTKMFQHIRSSGHAALRV